MVKLSDWLALVELLAGSPVSWIVVGEFTVYACVAGKAIGLRLSGRMVLFWGATVTWKLCDVEVLVDGSVAVTVIVEVSPTCAWVVLMCTTPLGLVLER